MDGIGWLLVAGIVLLATLLTYLAWAYATRRLKVGPNEQPVESGWLPHALRMKPLGHGIYRAQEQRRKARRDEAPPEG